MKSAMRSQAGPAVFLATSTASLSAKPGPWRYLHRIIMDSHSCPPAQLWAEEKREDVFTTIAALPCPEPDPSMLLLVVIAVYILVLQAKHGSR